MFTRELSVSQILFQEQYFRLRHKIVIGNLNSEGGCMASFKQKMANKAVLFAYDHKQISKRGKRLGDSYKEVKKTIENIFLYGIIIFV